ncbi:MAG TPA: hypothetical protein VNT29_07410, partial [Candidatus Limnocylindrales bacterium]|nr:hypothetical protein [Candidatus Limnocylindrales bacterium]
MTETPDDGDKNTKKDTDHKGIFDSFKELVRAAGDQRNPYLRFALLLILVVVFTIIALAVIGRQIDAAAERLIDIALIGAILVAILLIFRHQSRADAAPEAASSQPTPPMSVTCEPTATFRQIVLITPAVSNFFDLIVSSVSITAHKEQLNVIVKVPNRRFEAAAQNSLINAVCDDLVR